MDSIHFEGQDFMVTADELSDEFLQDLLDCGKSGDSEEATDYVLHKYKVTGNAEDCKAYLKAYGAWEDEQLQDHAENLKRLIWMSGCNLHEGEDIYFNTYG